MNNRHTPPRLAIWFIEKMVPARINDAVIGDLIEEYEQKLETSRGAGTKASIQFWIQTMSVCMHFSKTKQNIIAMALMMFSMMLVSLLVKAMAFLSVYDDPLFEQQYWLNGNVHMVLLENQFWNFSTLESNFEWHMLINAPSIVWAVFALSASWALNKKLALTVNKFAIISTVVMVSPYVYGMLTLRFNQLPLNEVGPVIAFMWASMMYLIVPVCLGIIRKIKGEDITIKALS